MNIHLLGGSNAGMRDGWAAQMQRLAAGETIDNRFLGAVGSLYGLMRLMKSARDAEAPAHAIVFEFCLNDILLFEAGVLRPAMVADALEQMANLCARQGAPLVFLCLEPRPDARASLAKAKRRARALYAAAAARHGLHPCVWLEDCLSRTPAAGDFQDENHLTPEASTLVAAHVLDLLRNNAVVAPRASAAAPVFEYVDATQAQGVGACERREITTRVFSGPFLRLSRGGASLWPGAGVLAALMLFSTDESGWYRIDAAGSAYRKNPCSQMQAIVPRLMLLHYVTRLIRVNAGLRISMPARQRDLDDATEDASLLAAPPRAPFDAQMLDIHGVIFWRPRTLTRLRLALRRWL